MDADELARLASDTTPGPWGWRGYTDGSIELRALHSGGLRIVSTARAERCIVLLDNEALALADGACDVCRKKYDALTTDPDHDFGPCAKPENLDTVWLRGDGFIEPANQWARREVPYRNDVSAVEHPDAELIAAAPELLAEVRALRTQRDSLVKALEEVRGYLEQPEVDMALATIRAALPDPVLATNRTSEDRDAS